MGRTPKKESSSFNILNGSDDDSDDIGDDFVAKPTPKLFRQSSRNPAWETAESNSANIRNKNSSDDDINTINFRQQQQQHSNDPIPRSFSHGTKKQSSLRRKDTSMKKPGDEFNMNDIADQLPKHLRTNLSQMSSTVRRIYHF